jgi:hypothetical protein
MATTTAVVTVEETRLPGAADFLVIGSSHTFLMQNARVHRRDAEISEHGSASGSLPGEQR